MMNNRLLTGFMACLLGSGIAVAQPSAAQQKAAEEEFTRGNTAYNLGRFDAAVDHFMKAYEAWPLPDFLYNIAQAYRLGGNCKQAVYFYKRFRSLKEGDTVAPLSAKKRAEIEKFISELAECAAKADAGANTQPQGLDKPPPATNATATGVPATNATATTAQASPEPLDEDDGEEQQVEAQTVARAKIISARLESGIALLRAGDLDIPVQPAFAVSGGYPLSVGPTTVELGAGLSYTPLPYQVMGAQKQGTMLGARARAVVSLPIASKLSLRGDLGLGVVSLRGLEMGNPLTTDYSAGSFTLLNVRVGMAAEYEITPNLAATLQPLAIAYSPGADGMYADSLSEIDVLVGVGYRK